MLQIKKKILKKSTEFFSRVYLVEFLLKIVLNLEEIRKYYCPCKIGHICNVCCFYELFKNEQYTIYANSLDYDFLEKFHCKLFNFLINFLKEDSHFVCRLITHDYNYTFKGWSTGDIKYFTIIQIINNHERDKIK